MALAQFWRQRQQQLLKGPFFPHDANAGDELILHNRVVTAKSPSALYTGLVDTRSRREVAEAYGLDPGLLQYLATGCMNDEDFEAVWQHAQQWAAHHHQAEEADNHNLEGATSVDIERGSGRTMPPSPHLHIPPPEPEHTTSHRRAPRSRDGRATPASASACIPATQDQWPESLLPPAWSAIAEEAARSSNACAESARPILRSHAVLHALGFSRDLYAPQGVGWDSPEMRAALDSRRHLWRYLRAGGDAHMLPRMPMVLEGCEDLASMLKDMCDRNAGCVTQGNLSHVELAFQVLGEPPPPPPGRTLQGSVIHLRTAKVREPCLTRTTPKLDSQFMGRKFDSTLKDIQHLFDRDHRGACPSLIVSANEASLHAALRMCYRARMYLRMKKSDITSDMVMVPIHAQKAELQPSSSNGAQAKKEKRGGKGTEQLRPGITDDHKFELIFLTLNLGAESKAMNAMEVQWNEYMAGQAARIAGSRGAFGMVSPEDHTQAALRERGQALKYVTQAEAALASAAAGIAAADTAGHCLAHLPEWGSIFDQAVQARLRSLRDIHRPLSPVILEAALVHRTLTLHSMTRAAEASQIGQQMQQQQQQVHLGLLSPIGTILDPSTVLSPQAWEDWMQWMQAVVCSTAYLSACTATTTLHNATDQIITHACVDVLMRSADLLRSMLALARFPRLASAAHAVLQPHPCWQLGVTPEQALAHIGMYLLGSLLDLCKFDDTQVNHHLRSAPSWLRDLCLADVIQAATITRFRGVVARQLSGLQSLGNSGGSMDSSSSTGSDQHSAPTGQQYDPSSLQWGGTLESGHYGRLPTSSTSTTSRGPMQYTSQRGPHRSALQPSEGTSNAFAGGGSSWVEDLAPAGPPSYPHASHTQMHHHRHGLWQHLQHRQQHHQGAAAGPVGTTPAVAPDHPQQPSNVDLDYHGHEDEQVVDDALQETLEVLLGCTGGRRRGGLSRN